MNYYIQGDAANADKIKAAFEKLGYDTTGHLFTAKSVLYFTLDGGIRATTCNCTPAIIKTHPDYKELELPVEPKFKKGDWIACDADSFTLSIKSLKDGNYYFHQGASLPIKDIDEHYHLWTIADAKDGDVLVSGIDNPFIYNGNIEFSSAGAYVGVSRDGRIRLDMFPSKSWTSVKDVKPATKEQRHFLFQKMKENGCEWDADKKELRKIKPHYDISNFHAGMPVLVRDNKNEEWRHTTFSHISSRFYKNKFAAGCTYWCQCIPFEGNEHLLGTSDPCDEQYINWQFIEL